MIIVIKYKEEFLVLFGLYVKILLNDIFYFVGYDELIL